MSSLTITNVQLVNTGKYQVLITNLFLPTGTRSSNAFLTVLLDSDGDHIPDDWENFYGFNANSAADASADPDGDGMSNYQEYIAGTDPLDRNSYLHIDAPSPIAGGGTVLSFIAVSNRTYTVLYRDSAKSGGWQPLTNIDPPLATNRLLFVT